MVSLCTFTSFPWKDQSKWWPFWSKARKKYTNSLYLYTWCCCLHEADVTWGSLCSLVYVHSPQPWPACTPLQAAILLSLDHWILRASEEGPWDHKKPKWWHLSLASSVLHPEPSDCHRQKVVVSWGGCFSWDGVFCFVLVFLLAAGVMLCFGSGMGIVW